MILDQILPRLPVKSLLRFKSVCKDWRSTISTPEFEKFRLAFSGSHHQFVLLEDNGWFSPSINNNPNYLMIRESYEYDNKLTRIIGCCNGLVGFITKISDGVRKFIVLNPATRQQVEILGPDDSTGFNSQSCWFWWFGYVSSVDDYYIVGFESFRNEFWTFSWKAGIWKRNLSISHKSARRVNRIDPLKRIGNPALINDSLYWPIDISDVFLNLSTEIVELNLVTEECEIKPQMNFAIGHTRHISLVNLKGCLALHTSSPKGCLDVWMLRQAGDWNSWENVFSQVLRHCRLIYYITTGKLLLGHWKQLMFVDDLSQLQPEDQESHRQREILHNSLVLGYGGVEDYVESMIWPFKRSERLGIVHRCKRAIGFAVSKITAQLAPKHCASSPSP
ncbi:hypothetical protein RND81_02G232700 [Saponaria officinalis]